MPTFLSDPPAAVYLVLAAVLFVTGLVWFNRRDRKSLRAFASTLGLLLIVLLIDTLVESPREEAVRRVKAMVAAADAHDPDGFVNHISDRFEYQGESGNPIVVSRDAIRRDGFWGVLRQFNVHVAAWDFSRGDVKEIDQNTIEIGFLAKGEAEGKQFPMYFRATFARQGDGQLKMTRFASFDPIKRTNERKSIPGFNPKSP